MKRNSLQVSLSPSSPLIHCASLRLQHHWLRVCTGVRHPATSPSAFSGMLWWFIGTQKHTCSIKWTYSHVVDGHAHSPVVIDLLRGYGLGLVGQEDAEQQQQAFIAVHHACRCGQDGSCEEDGSAAPLTQRAHISHSFHKTLKHDAVQLLDCFPSYR